MTKRKEETNEEYSKRQKELYKLSPLARRRLLDMEKSFRTGIEKSDEERKEGELGEVK